MRIRYLDLRLKILGAGAAVGNPYPGRFLDLLDREPGPALDIGSGGRDAPPGVMTLDIAGAPGVLGDALALPFRDESFGLVLSQAVLEHVTNPQTAIDEVRRVLRPGGLSYVEVAFMQPLHQEPRHYFNVTPHGLQWLLRDWEVVNQGETGTPSDVLDWVRRAYGLKPGQLPKGIRPARYRLASSGVYATARRPV